ncbi:MAG TPA: hypothetical protein PLI79_01300 [Mycobacterium sp.]|nr:hypothetical protein [Mycobacterium sp.]
MADKKYLNAVVQVVAGLGLNIFPAMFIAVYARIAPIELQGFLALSLAVGVYVAQLINAFIVEGRLATPEADHDFSLPSWVALLSLAAGLVLILGPPVTVPAALMGSSIGVMTGLLVARSIGVVSGRTKQEALASVLLIVSGAGAVVLAARHSGHSVRLLAGGALAAILIRYLPRTVIGRWGMPPDLRRSSWVTAETAVVGAVQPAITSLVLTTIGPAASVAFRVVSTVSGALEPIIAYGRYRLLAHGHRGEVAIVVAIFSAGLAIVLVAAFGGFGKLVFGPAWNQVGAAALLLACLWKGLMLVSTVPFAALRKAGETKVVFWIRALSSVVYLVIGSAFLWIWHSNAAIFAAFVLAEALTAILYHRIALRSAPAYEDSFGHRSAGGDR